MKEYIGREAFLAEKRKQYCADCDRRKGMKNGKMRFCYDIGEAPCRACSVNDMLNDVEDFPAADVVEVVRCKACVYGAWFDGYVCSHPEIRHLCNPDDYCSKGVRREEEHDEE